MAQEMERLGGTSEEEEEDEMEMEVKEEEDEEEDENEKKAMAAAVIVASGGNAGSSMEMMEAARQQGSSMKRCRPKEEKERTKLRERHRRAITARILAGLRRHGNYNLRVRADINDVIAALAREAGWVVLPDGTTFPSRSQVRHFLEHFMWLSSFLILLFKRASPWAWGWPMGKTFSLMPPRALGD